MSASKWSFKMSNGDTVGLEYAGTAIGSIVILLFMVLVGAVALGVASTSTISGPLWALIAFVVMMSTIQVFGTDVLEALGEYKNGSAQSIIVDTTNDELTIGADGAKQLKDYESK